MYGIDLSSLVEQWILWGKCGLEGLKAWQNYSFSVAWVYDCPTAPVRKINKGLANSFLSSVLNISLWKTLQTQVLSLLLIQSEAVPLSLLESCEVRGKVAPEMNTGTVRLCVRSEGRKRRRESQSLVLWVAPFILNMRNGFETFIF